MSKSTKSKILDKAATPLAASVGQTFKDAWDIVFGGFGTYVEKKRLTWKKDLEDFKAELYQNIDQIPEENRIEPKLSTLGPALEASKYYFEEKDIRALFAKLIAASMDDRTCSDIHPSFVEKIKQMTPLDAQNLALFKNNYQYAVAEYQLVRENRSTYSTLYLNIFLSNPNQSDLEQQSVSISSLESLGLVETSYLTKIANDNAYEQFDKTELFQNLVVLAKDSNEAETITFAPGVVTLTQMGRAFISVCY